MLNKEEFRNKFLLLLRDHEGALSDGFRYYGHEDEQEVDQLLTRMADKLWDQLQEDK